MVGNVVNTTIKHHPEVLHFLPEGVKDFNSFFEEIVSNAYLYGRDWIQNNVRQALSIGENNITNTKIEKQILEVWDRAYNLWLIRNVNDTGLIRTDRMPYNWNKLFDALKTLNFTLCLKILKENIDIILSVIDSVWTVLKGNISLLLSATTAVFSLLLGGGTALMNFFLNLASNLQAVRKLIYFCCRLSSSLLYFTCYALVMNNINQSSW